MGPQALVRNAHFSHQQPWLIILNHQCLFERKMVAVPMKMFEEKGRLFHSKKKKKNQRGKIPGSHKRAIDVAIAYVISN